MPGTALLTDHYELTMLRGALGAGVADRRCVFEVFTRHLPAGRRYGVLAGTGRLLPLLESFRYDAEDLEALLATGVLDQASADHLDGHSPRLRVDGMAEGEVFFADEPVLTVEGTFADCVLLETLVLSVLNHDSAVAGAAARMVSAAGDRACVEMGSRRTHEQAAVAAARAAYVVGFAATSNLAAGVGFGVPTRGTSAHAFSLLFADERDAFAAQVQALGAGTTLLVDTFDVAAAVQTAVAVAGPGLGAIRLDSGDLAGLAHQVRRQLDQLGCPGTQVVVTSDLDEYAIAGLATAPVDSYGVGTALVTGSGHPTAGFVYKLVARALEPGADAPLLPVAKTSAGKVGHGGRKSAVRCHDSAGMATHDLVRTTEPAPALGERDLHVPLLRPGGALPPTSLAEARQHHARCVQALPPEARQLSRGEPALPVRTT